MEDIDSEKHRSSSMILLSTDLTYSTVRLANEMVISLVVWYDLVVMLGDLVSFDEEDLR